MQFEGDSWRRPPLHTPSQDELSPITIFHEEDSSFASNMLSQILKIVAELYLKLIEYSYVKALAGPILWLAIYHPPKIL